MSKSFLPFLTAAIVLGSCSPDAAHDKSIDQTRLVRHGDGHLSPFWNQYSGRYIYPPAFEIRDSTDWSDPYIVESGPHSVELSSSTDNISSLWSRLDPGFVTLTFRHATEEDDGFIYDISTIKSPGFSDSLLTGYQHPADRGVVGLEAVYRKPAVQHWLSPGGPDPDYQLWVHPSKLMGVLSQGMLFLSRETDNVEVASGSRSAAIAIGEFLLDLSEPPGSSLAGWPPSYWDGVERGDHPIYMSQIMSLYPSEAGMAFLDLYDATQDEKWRQAAVAIAEKYQETQRADGTWSLLINRETGEGVGSKLLVPVSVLYFLDRLSEQYGEKQYQQVRNAAFNWIMENPVISYAWDAQFEDTRPKITYKNLSHREATNFAKLLFRTTNDSANLALAEHLMAFVEDQFVIWTHDDAVTKKNWFRDGLKWNGTTDDGGKDWFLPAALEQYAFYTPIAGTTSNVIHAYCAGYEATGKSVYRDKARALSMSLVRAQHYHGTGEIPTHLRKELPEDNWLNNSVYSAQTLVDASCL